MVCIHISHRMDAFINSISNSSYIHTAICIFNSIRKSLLFLCIISYDQMVTDHVLLQGDFIPL